MAATRPLIPAGPMARARMPASRSGSTAAARSDGSTAAGSERKNSETTKGTDFRSMQTSTAVDRIGSGQGSALRGEWPVLIRTKGRKVWKLYRPAGTTSRGAAAGADAGATGDGATG